MSKGAGRDLNDGEVVMIDYPTVDLLIEAIDEEPAGPLTSEGVALVRKGWAHGQEVAEAEISTLRQQLDQAMALVDRFKAATMKAEQNGYGQDSVHHDDSWIDEMGAALDEAQRLRGEVNDD